MTKIVAEHIINFQSNADQVFASIDQSLKNINKKIDQTGNAMESQQKKSNSFFSTMKQGFKQIASIALPYISFKATIGYLAETSKYLVKIKNNTHATTQEMQSLREKVANVSKDGTISIKDMYSGILQLSRTLNPEEINKSVEAVSQFAHALPNTDFTAAADIYSGAFQIFKEEGMSAIEIADRLAFAIDKFNVNDNDLSGFFQNASRAILGSKQQMKDTMAFLQVMKGELRISGNVGGTLYKNVIKSFQNLKDKDYRTLGVKQKDVDVKQVGLVNTIANLDKAFKNLSSKQKLEKLNKVFSPDTAAAIASFFTKVDSLQKAKQDIGFEGFGLKTRKSTADSFYGQWTGLWNDIMSIGEAGSSLEPALAEATKNLRGVLKGIIDIISIIMPIVNGIIKASSILFGAIGILRPLSNEEKAGGQTDKTKAMKLAVDSMSDDTIDNYESYILPQGTIPKIKGYKNINNKFNQESQINSQNISIMPTKNINDISLKIELDTKDKNILPKIIEKKTDSDIKMTLINKDYSF